jgi:Putative adhesin
MKRMVLLFAALMVAQLAAAEDWNKTFNLTGKPDLRVETSDAKLTVDTWDQTKIEAHVRVLGYKIGPGGIDIYDHQSGDNVVLEVRYPHQHITFGWEGHGKRVEIEIHMPREGRVDLKTGDGAIRLTGFKGDMTVTSGDGGQEIDGVDGVLRARAGDGHISVSGRFDGLSLHTGDGRIEATARPESTIKQEWELRAGDGSVTLRLPEKLAANVDFQTHDGHLDVDMPVTVQGGRLKENLIRGTMNGGGNLLTIHTGDGSIHVERS